MHDSIGMRSGADMVLNLEPIHESEVARWAVGQKAVPYRHPGIRRVV